MACYKPSSRNEEADFDISDVLDAIETTDPDAINSIVAAPPQVSLPSPMEMAQNHNHHQQQQYPQQLPHHQDQFLPQSQQQHQQMLQSSNMSSTSCSRSLPLPTVEIIEQPASKAMRFRYECEGRSAGSIPGVNSTPENKTYPTIRISGYKGRAIVVVSCVTRDGPKFRPHPHNLVGKECCRDGVCRVNVNQDNMTVSFSNLGIQCVKRKDIEPALSVREKLNVDPFKTGFSHKKHPTSIDLNSVRLCFQVFLDFKKKGDVVALEPVVSEPIYDKKAMSDLVIVRLSHHSSEPQGQDMILLCEKVAKEDIQVRFFQEREGHLIWESYGDFTPQQVHKQVAIIFKSPSYNQQELDEPASVYVQLKRPSDGATSDPLPFMYKPNYTVLRELDSVRRKRQKLSADRTCSPKPFVFKHIQADADLQTLGLAQHPMFNFNYVKTEPEDVRRSPYNEPMNRSPSGFPASPNPNFYGYQNPSPLSVPSPLSNVASPLGNIAVTTQASPTYSLLQPVQAINVPHTSPNMMAGSTYLDLNNLSQGPVIHQQQAVEQPQQFNDFPFPDAVDMLVGDASDVSITDLLKDDNNQDNSKVSLTALENILGVSEVLSNVSLSEVEKLLQ